MTVVAINSVKELDDLAGQCRCLVVHFAADFVDQCAQVDQVMNQLAADYHQQQQQQQLQEEQQQQQLQEEQQQQQLVRFCRVLAEQVPDLSTAHAITAAPTVVLLLANSGATPDSGRFRQFGRVEGVNSRQLTDKVCQLTAAAAANSPSSFATASPAAAASTATTAAGGGDSEKELLRQRLRQLITRSKCMVFMKGTPDQPRCGFSRQLVALLRATSCQFDSFDILTDEPVRQELKAYSNWPTYPQLYVDGELVGGLDIVRDLSESGELTATLGL